MKSRTRARQTRDLYIFYFHVHNARTSTSSQNNFDNTFESQGLCEHREVRQGLSKIHSYRWSRPYNSFMERNSWKRNKNICSPWLRSLTHISVSFALPVAEKTRFIFSRSHDNAKFASSGGDRSVFLWDVATGVTTRRLSGHMSKIHVVEFNQDATVVASGL